MSLDVVINRLKRIDPNQLIAASLAGLETDILNLNKSQLEEGKKSDGQDVTPKYKTNKYATFKKAIGSKSSPVPDLKLTGKFYDGFDLDIKKTEAEIGSDDKKAPFLEKKYTEKIYGLTEENMSLVRAKLLVNLTRNFRRVI